MSALPSNVQGDLLENLHRVAKNVKGRLREVAVEVVREKLALSNERVPYKRGKLHDSGRYSVRYSTVDNTIYIKITYGNSEVWYAIKVHEDLEAKHRGRRRAKFLESVLQESNFGAEISARFSLAECL